MTTTRHSDGTIAESDPDADYVVITQGQHSMVIDKGGVAAIAAAHTARHGDGDVARLHDRYLAEPRFRAVTDRLREIIREMQDRTRTDRGGVGDYLGSYDLLAFAEAIDVLYRPAAAPLDPALAEGNRAHLVAEARVWQQGRFARAEPVVAEMIGRLADALEERTTR